MNMIKAKLLNELNRNPFKEQNQIRLRILLKKIGLNRKLNLLLMLIFSIFQQYFVFNLTETN